LNIILIVADALRRDYLSCYGYNKNVTSNLDKLASEGVTFTQAVTVSTLTPVSFSSLFTGTYPFQHGIRDFSYILQAKFPTLAEVLREQGYYTSAIIGSVVLDRSRKFNRGFVEYNDTFSGSFSEERKVVSDPENEIIFRYGEVTSSLATKWLKDNTSRKFFLFLHYWDTHIPFFPPKKFLREELLDYKGKFNGSVEQVEKFNAGQMQLDEADLEYVRGLYEGGVKNIDAGVGGILQTLGDLGIRDKTLIIFTSDHGCNLGEHNFIGNARLLYENDLLVPLILSGPPVAKQKGLRVEQMISNVDLFPTLMDYLDIPFGEQVRGRSLKSVILRGKPHGLKYAYSETFFPSKHVNKRISLRGVQWKLIREPLKEGKKRAGIVFKKMVDNLKTFFYRFLTNRKHRRLLLSKLWDRLVLRHHSKLYSEVENMVRKRRGRVRELYQIGKDSAERENCIDREKRIAQEMEEALRNFRCNKEDGEGGASQVADEVYEQKLKDLGYI